MTDLRAIVYVSSARHPLTPDVLDDLLERARRRNQREGITGFLLYCDGNFMQTIEGAPAPLAAVYASIRADPLHHGIVELLDEPVTQREFDGWAMAYTPVQMREFRRLSGAPWEDGAAAAADEVPRNALYRIMMRDFWRQHGMPGV